MPGVRVIVTLPIDIMAKVDAIATLNFQSRSGVIRSSLASGESLNEMLNQCRNRSPGQFDRLRRVARRYETPAALLASRPAEGE